jgi:hypothetical protein
MRPFFTITAPTTGFGDVCPCAREASLIAKRMKRSSDLGSVRGFIDLLSFPAEAQRHVEKTKNILFPYLCISAPLREILGGFPFQIEAHYNSMNTATTEPTPDLTMEELLGIFPGARRTLFQLHHIGGCSSCGFSSSETLAQICARNGGLDPVVVLGEIKEGHLKDEALLISSSDLHARITDPSIRLLDIRTREEFEAVAT